MGLIKILSWNVNGIKARMEAVRKLAEEIQPDFMCFQKVRSKGVVATTIPGYHNWHGSMGDSLFGGVSTYIRTTFPFDYDSQDICIPDWLSDTGCINVINLNSCFLVNVYVPYVDLKNEDYVRIRQSWDFELLEFLAKLSKRKPLIVCGDFNIVSQDIDAWDDISTKNAGCFTEWEHRNFNSLLKKISVIDSYRYLHPTERNYTYFYNNKPEYRFLNQGYRIDYFLVSDSLLPNVRKSEILLDIPDTTNNPIFLEIDLSLL